MRIISKFKDYYDYGLYFGIDSTLVYYRETKEDEDSCIDRIKFSHFNKFRRNLSENYIYKNFKIDKRNIRFFFYHKDVSQKFLHFCGKVYPFYYINLEEIERGESPLKKEINKFNHFIWASDHISDFFEEFQKDDWFLNKRNHHGFGSTILDPKDEFKVRECNDLNLRFNSPIVLEQSNGNKIHYTINPNLRDIHFFDVMNDNSTFQEISQYLAYLSTQKLEKRSKQTDKEKVLSHGMDPKYSFRKESKKS